MTKIDGDKRWRHSLRLSGYDYSAVGAYFITICTIDRHNLFGDGINGVMRLNPFGQIVAEEWTACGCGHPDIVLDAYVVMPNHFHGIVIFTDDIRAIPVGANDVVGAIHELPLHNPPTHEPIANELPLQKTLTQESTTDKLPHQQTTRNQRRKMALPKLIGRFKMHSAKRINELRGTPAVSIWQRNYYEHIIRDEDELNGIREYIEFNPSRWAEDEDNLYGKT